MKKTIFTVVLLVLVAGTFWAQSESDFQVQQNADNILTITGYMGSRMDVVIPSTLYGLRVTAIGERAFYNKKLTSVVIPNTVVTIMDGAFNQYDNGILTEVIIPDSVTTIGHWAFQKCGITRLSLGTGVRVISSAAFASNKITELTIPANVREVWGNAFNNNQIKSLTIMNGVTRVGIFAFAGNLIETLVIPASLAASGIDSGAFNLGSSFVRITVPANMNDSYLRGSGISGDIGLEQGFINFYKSQNKAAGTYVKNGPIWTRQ